MRWRGCEYRGDGGRFSGGAASRIMRAIRRGLSETLGDIMNRTLPVALALLLGALPAAADEFTDTLEGALKAYRDGDVKATVEDLGYATKLLSSQRAAALVQLLPPAPAGWTRTDDDTEDAAIGMAIFGGGTTAGATYSDGADDIKLTLVADSPMIGGMGAMISGLASMGGGKPLRINRVEFGQNDGELQGIVKDKVMISVSGSAPVEKKEALLETIDFDALADY